jgi:hypothetical protein
MVILRVTLILKGQKVNKEVICSITHKRIASAVTPNKINKSLVLINIYQLR